MAAEFLKYQKVGLVLNWNFIFHFSDYPLFHH